MRTPPLLADFIHPRNCKPICENSLTLPVYLRENPGVSNKSYIARQLGMDVSTVRKYYDEIRAELAGQEVQMATYQEIGC